MPLPGRQPFYWPGFLQCQWNKFIRASRFYLLGNQWQYSRHSSVTDMITKLGWTPLKNRLTLLFKARLVLFAIPVDDLLQPVRCPSQSQHQDSYHLPHTNKYCCKFSFFPRTVRDWNRSLPHQLTTLPNPGKFKAVVLSYISNVTNKNNMLIISSTCAHPSCMFDSTWRVM